MFTKESVLRALIEKLREERGAILEAANAAHEAATHEQSKPENQYDTRGLEASYLASAQGQRADELKRLIATLEGIRAGLGRADAAPATNRAEAAAAKAGLGSLVLLEIDGQEAWYLLIGEGGGGAVAVDGKSVSVITPRAPLGESLLDREIGEDFEFEMRGKTRGCRVVRID